MVASPRRFREGKSELSLFRFEGWASFYSARCAALGQRGNRAVCKRGGDKAEIVFSQGKETKARSSSLPERRGANSGAYSSVEGVSKKYR